MTAADLHTILSLYCQLPDAPRRHRSQDRQVALRWLQQGVPLEDIRAAFLLAALRRAQRPAEREPLPTIRSLAYFEPVLREVQQHKLSHDYLDYLERVMRKLHENASSTRSTQAPAESAD